MNRRDFLKASGFFAATGLMGSYPLFIERFLVEINRYRIPVPNLPAEFNGFTVAQLTDLHYGRLVPFSFLEDVILKTNNIPKDITVCTGDYVRNRRKEINKIWPLLSELKAPLGVHSVLGNHDHWADPDRSIEWLEKSGQNLRHRVRCIERHGKKLWLAGGGDFEEDHKNIDDILSNVPEDDCKIVIAHNPDSADTDFTTRIDLMICGHTHGGQVNIPFLGTPVLPVKNKNYNYGLKKATKGHPIFISKGVGSAICPVRFNCYPEIAVLELVSA